MPAKNRAARLAQREAAVEARRVPCPYRAGDMVLIISGKDKGKVGNFLRYDVRKSRVFVEGRNQIEHWVKARPDLQREAGRYKTETSVHVSSTAWYCRDCSKAAGLKRAPLTPQPKDAPPITKFGRNFKWVCRGCDAERPAHKKQ
jgi:large subunit ribosomal protein L24